MAADKISKDKLGRFIDEIAPYLQDKKSPEFKKIKKEREGLKKLILDNVVLLRLFRGLARVENYLLQNLKSIGNIIQKSKIEQNKYPEITQLLGSLNRISNEIILLLKELFNIGEKEELTSKNILNLLSDKLIEQRVTEKWINAETKSEEEVKALISEEFEKYRAIKLLLREKKKIIGQLIKLLEAEKEEEKKLEEIRLEEPEIKKEEEKKKGEVGVLTPLDSEPKEAIYLDPDVLNDRRDPIKFLGVFLNDNGDLRFSTSGGAEDQARIYNNGIRWAIYKPDGRLLEIRVEGYTPLPDSMLNEDLENGFKIGDYSFSFRTVPYDEEARKKITRFPIVLKLAKREAPTTAAFLSYDDPNEPSKKRQIRIEAGKGINIGTGLDNDIILRTGEYNSIDDHHARILYQEGNFYLENLSDKELWIDHSGRREGEDRK